MGIPFLTDAAHRAGGFTHPYTRTVRIGIIAPRPSRLFMPEAWQMVAGG